MMQRRQPVRAIMKIYFQQEKPRGGEGNQKERPSLDEVQAGVGRKRRITRRMGRPQRKIQTADGRPHRCTDQHVEGFS